MGNVGSTPKWTGWGCSTLFLITDTVSEWLRSWTRSPMGFASRVRVPAVSRTRLGRVMESAQMDLGGAHNHSLSYCLGANPGDMPNSNPTNNKGHHTSVKQRNFVQSEISRGRLFSETLRVWSIYAVAVDE